MAVACASLAGAGGWEIGAGLALGALFTEAELAVADHLVQLSVSGSGSGGGGDEAESDSPRSVNTCAGAAAWEEEEEREEAALAGAGLGLGAMELDRRARKRFRLLSDVYAATRPVTTGADAARKRKRGHEPVPEAGTTIRYSGDRQCF